MNYNTLRTHFIEYNAYFKIYVIYRKSGQISIAATSQSCDFFLEIRLQVEFHPPGLPRSGRFMVGDKTKIKKITGKSLVFYQTGGGEPPDQTLKEKTGN